MLVFFVKLKVLLIDEHACKTDDWYVRFVVIGVPLSLPTHRRQARNCLNTEKVEITLYLSRALNKYKAVFYVHGTSNTAHLTRDQQELFYSMLYCELIR